MNWLRSLGNGRVLFRLLTAFTLVRPWLWVYTPARVQRMKRRVAIGLTDTPGDFLTYTVDVTSLTLTKADNTTAVQTLPQRTRVDFARSVDLTEFVTGSRFRRHLRQRDAEPRLHQRRHPGRRRQRNPVAVAPARYSTAKHPVTTLPMR